MSAIPIQVDLEVEENILQVDLDVEDQSIQADLEVATPIIVVGGEYYDGPYSVTPTEDPQTLETEELKMAHDVSIGAIPSDYVGSSIDRRTSSDLSASGKTVTAPAGYYAEEVSKDVATGSRGNRVNRAGYSGTKKTYSIEYPDATSGYYEGSIVANPGTIELERQQETVTPSESSQVVTPVNSYYYLEQVTVDPIPSNYVGSAVPRLGATSYTPTDQSQTIPAGKYLTGDQTINPIPPQYKDMSVPLAWLGPDAELVKEISLADVKLSATSFNGWTPSTTAKDILATRTAGTFVATNVADYEYIIVCETVIPIVTSSSATKKALPLFLAAYQVQEIIRRPSSYPNILAGNNNNSVNISAFTTGTFLRYYGTTENSMTYTWNASYAFYSTVTANTLSSTTAASPTITLKSPKVSARCSTTYMSTGNAALIDQDSTVISQKVKVYRTNKPGIMQGIYNEICRLVSEVDA